jgi:AcrR family transcriptional regulator
MTDSLRLAAARQQQVATAKGERTRERILDTALRSFYERGWRQTTMRQIARDSGVSLGNAYYYFRSKESLIQAIYAQSHEEHAAACAPILASEVDFEAGLLGVMRAKLDTLAPYHRFAAALFAAAADPASPLNPWSAESEAVRHRSTQLFADLVARSNARASKALRTELPSLLWTYHMGVILFWVHDRSPGCVRSYRLVDSTVPLIVRLLALSRLPPLRPLVRSLVALVNELRNGAEGRPPSPGRAEGTP